MYSMGKEAVERFFCRSSYKIIGKIKLNKSSKFNDRTVILIKFLLAYESKNDYYLLFIKEDFYDVRAYNSFRDIYGYFNDIASVPSELYVREE